MGSPRLEVKSITIPANGSRLVPVGGTMIKCLTSTGAAGAVKVRFGGGGQSRLDALDKLRVPDKDAFQEFYLENTTGGAVTVTIVVGDGDVDTGGDVTITGVVDVADQQADGVDDIADVTLTNGVATVLLPLDLTRTKAVIVSDPANTVVIRLGKAATVAAARGAMLQIGQSYTHNSTAALYGFAAAAAQKISGTIETRT